MGILDIPSYSRTQADSRFAPFLFGPRAPSFTPKARAKRSIVSAFQAGHGWTVVAGAPTSSNLNDTTDFVYGSQAVSITKAAASVNFRSPALGPVNMTGRNICMLIKVEGLTSLTEIRMQCGDSSGLTNGKSVAVPINVADPAGSYTKNGEWQWVEATIEGGSTLGTGDLSACTYFQVRIVGAAGVVVHIGAIGYRDRPTDHPTGVLCFTFDDSYKRQSTIARPILDTYGFPATLFPIAEKVDSNSNFLASADIDSMVNFSGWEVAVHSLTTAGHDAAGGFTGLTDAALQQELVGGRDFIHTHGWGNGEGLAWPQGASNVATEQTASKVQSYARSNTPESRETYPVNNYMRIRSVPVGATSTDTLLNGYIATAAAQRTLLVLTIHDVVASGATGIQMNQSVLASVAAQAAAVGIEVLTMSDALKAV